MSSVIHIPATGNADTDTANIQNAADRLTTTLAGKNPGCVILSGGDYRINKTLKFGELGPSGDIYSNNSNPPRLISAGTAHLTWEGGSTTDYMLELNDPRYCPGAGLGNLVLWCGNNCRGIKVQHATYSTALQSVWVRQSRQVGIDVVDCWGSAIRDIIVDSCAGIGMRLTQFNSGYMSSIKIGGEGTDWPADDDASVEYYNGKNVQTSLAQRAALVINTGNDFIGDNIMLEGCNYPETACMSIYNFVFGAITGLRFEGSTNTYQRIKMMAYDWDDDENRSGASHWTFRNITRGSASCACVVRANSIRHEGIVIDGVWDNVTDGILICDGGKHYGHQVKRVNNPHDDDELPMDKWIVEENSPTMSGKISAISDNEVAIPWK